MPAISARTSIRCSSTFSIAGLGFFYFNNMHTLSSIFDRKLNDKDQIAARRAHVVGSGDECAAAPIDRPAAKNIAFFNQLVG